MFASMRASCVLALAKIRLRVCALFPPVNRRVDYGGLGRVINTVIATQAQGLAHSEVITCSPVDCSPSPSLSHKTEHSPCGNTEFPELKFTWKSPLKGYARTSSFIGTCTFSFLTCSLFCQTGIVFRCAYMHSYLLCLGDFGGAESICHPLAALSAQGRRVRGI